MKFAGVNEEIIRSIEVLGIWKFVNIPSTILKS